LAKFKTVFEQATVKSLKQATIRCI